MRLFAVPFEASNNICVRRAAPMQGARKEAAFLPPLRGQLRPTEIQRRLRPSQRLRSPLPEARPPRRSSAAAPLTGPLLNSQLLLKRRRSSGVAPPTGPASAYPLPRNAPSRILPFPDRKSTRLNSSHLV